MEVILRETIDTLGRAGQIVKVKPGYARNYLLPRKLAYLATPGNLKVIEFERQSLVRKEAKQKGEADQFKALLDAVEITIRRCHNANVDLNFAHTTNPEERARLDRS